MNEQFRIGSADTAFGIGSYSAADAARLLALPARSIRRWLGGYRISAGDHARDVPPLWSPHLPAVSDAAMELSFRDLIELRFVKAFLDAGLPLATIRRCLDFARECVGDAYPFSTRRFQTDGQTIFLDGLAHAGENRSVLDLRRRQFAFRPLIERTFRDLDMEGDVVVRWRPYRGKATIVLDPDRAFGQPITSDSGVPTAVLADAVEAEGSVERAARLFEVPPAVVEDARAFEASLARPA
jgi:uncharacterized protein (DUF433 family)